MSEGSVLYNKFTESQVGSKPWDIRLILPNSESRPWAPGKRLFTAEKQGVSYKMTPIFGDGDSFTVSDSYLTHKTVIVSLEPTHGIMQALSAVLSAEDLENYFEMRTAWSHGLTRFSKWCFNKKIHFLARHSTGDKVMCLQNLGNGRALSNNAGLNVEFKADGTSEHSYTEYANTGVRRSAQMSAEALKNFEKSVNAENAQISTGRLLSKKNNTKDWKGVKFTTNVNAVDHVNITGWNTEKDTKMSNVVENAKNDVMNAVKISAEITAGRTLNGLVLDKVMPFLPENVQFLASTPLGAVVVANAINVMAEVYRERAYGDISDKLTKMSAVMVTASTVDFVDGFDIDGMIREFVGNEAIAKVVNDL
jgi:hypothetical protein